MVGKQVVIDSSAAVNAALVADALADWQEVALTAPTLLWSEAASAFSQLRWRGEISGTQVEEAMRRLLEAPITFVPSRDVIAEAAVLASELGWAKTYDAEYVVLARRLGARLLTVDGRLRAAMVNRVTVISPADL